MRFFFAILLAAALSSATAQNINLECTFTLRYPGDELYQEYECIIQGVTVTDRSANITFSGQHVDNLTNADVDTVTIAASKTPFIIPQMFEAFSNMRTLLCNFCELESIEFPQSDTLEMLFLIGNNITRIQSRLLANVPNLDNLYLENNNISVIEDNAFESDVLTYLMLGLNNLERIPNGIFSGIPNLQNLILGLNFIEAIDENAFQGLSNLVVLNLAGNRIRELAPLTLHPLVKALDIDLDQNLLTRIEENTFANNTELELVSFRHNQINEISPSFSRELQLGGNVRTVNMLGNQCANRVYTASPDTINFISLNRGLRTCFLNFAGEEDSDNIAMKFAGSLRILDPFGNVLARV